MFLKTYIIGIFVFVMARVHPPSHYLRIQFFRLHHPFANQVQEKENHQHYLVIKHQGQESTYKNSQNSQSQQGSFQLLTTKENNILY